MSDSILLSVRLPADLAGRLEALAEKKDPDQELPGRTGYRRLHCAEEEFFAAIAHGESDADAGRLVDHEELSRWLSAVARGKRCLPPQSRRKWRCQQQV